ncbi:MAG: helix-turn-helix domain-containing protein, partial [Dehalococcoidales bacterium]|nr:helix-turn-helix domain-containing protein [Dehalococcoidales bacterium]
KVLVQKKQVVVRLYLAGLSYSETAAKAGVSKATVANIVAELKAGQLPGVGDIADQIEVLRELAVGLEKAQVTPVQAVVGLAVLTHLNELGVEPNEIAQVAAVCHDLAGEKGDPKAFMKAALALEEVKKHTGLKADELESKVKGLQEAAAQLEPLATESIERQKQVAELGAKKQGLAQDVSALSHQQEVLKKDIALKEQREKALAVQIADLEEKAHLANVQLAEARQDLKTLAKIGLSAEDLSLLTHELKGIAKHHGLISPGALSKRLFDELVKLDKLLGLESVIKARQAELLKVEDTVSQAEEEAAAIKAANNQLRQEQSGLQAAVAEIKKHIAGDLETIDAGAKQAMAQLKEELGAGMQESLEQVSSLKNKALEVGKEMGQIESAIESNEWVRVLHALVRGEDTASPGQVRAVGLTVMKAMSAWLGSTCKGDVFASKVNASISYAALELEQWIP